MSSRVGLPVRDPSLEDHPKVKELRALSLWSEARRAEMTPDCPRLPRSAADCLAQLLGARLGLARDARHPHRRLQESDRLAPPQHGQPHVEDRPSPPRVAPPRAALERTEALTVSLCSCTCSCTHLSSAARQEACGRRRAAPPQCCRREVAERPSSCPIIA